MMLVLKAEFKKVLKSHRAAPLSHIPVLIVLYGFFWLITLGADLVQPGHVDMTLMIVHNMLGFIIWLITLSAISVIPQAISQEVSWGTFEHLHLGKVGINVILMARSLVNTLDNLFLVFVFVMIVGLTHRVMIFENVPGTLLVLLLTIPGVYGFAYSLGALVLLVKHIQTVVSLISLMIIVPVMVPTAVMPEVLIQLLRFWPVYQATYLLRMINLGGPSTWVGQGFAELVIGSAIFLAVGLLVFNLAERVAKKRGTLGLY